MGDKTLPILMILGGGLLIYCAVKNKSPAVVISAAIGNPNGGHPVPGKVAVTGDTITTTPAGGMGVRK